MRKALIYIVVLLFGSLCFNAGAQPAAIDITNIPRDRWIHEDGEFIKHLQQRDSILIGDQLEYGFRLEGVEPDVLLGYPALEESSLELIEDWTERRSPSKAGKGLVDIEASIRIAAFDEGTYNLPPIVIEKRTSAGQVDTMFFDPMEFEVKTLPLDMDTFERHPMKDLIQTPFNWDEFVYTVKEFWAIGLSLLPWLLLGKWVIILIILGICIWLIKEGKGTEAVVTPSEPAHIVALRKLDAFRSNAMWVPEKQKVFYTGVTDALREYIFRRYGVSAMEMTTAELFNVVNHVEGFPADQIGELKDLFETADFVKFAKYVASDEDNASAVPKAVRFVTQTYQSELEKQQSKAVEEKEDMKK